MSEPVADSKCCCQSSPAPTSTCCGPSPAACPGSHTSSNIPWIIGTITLAGCEIPQISTELGLADHLGAWKVRWAINRMGYRVEPGLYAVGSPGPDSPVLVSANYKLSFDRLRSQLSGLEAWVLVLDTQGVNVWCSAGKGTFGTDELVRRVVQYHLVEWIAHRTVIVPQLAAAGVAAHEVKSQTGMRVVFGPVRAEDLPTFLAAGMKASGEMRRVQFPLRDRVVLIPVDLVTSAKWVLLLASTLLALAGLGRDGYAWGRVMNVGISSAGAVLLVGFGSLVLGPAFLPWLPGRPFSLKGSWVGVGFVLAIFGSGLFADAFTQDWTTAVAWCLILPSVASVLVMKFTGTSTYTSLSGVRREMRVALPLQVASFGLGLVLWLAGRFL